MANINLLPWREERRAELKQEFLVTLGGVVVLGVALLVLVNMYFEGEISNQRERNNYLQGHIKELETQVQEISKLEQKKTELLDRMKVIQELQGNRPVIVRVFDEMVRSLPDGVFYQKLTRNNVKIKVSGIAESNNRVSSLMRNLDGSDWFANPNLTGVKAMPEFGEQASEFDMSFDISSPDAEKVSEE